MSGSDDDNDSVVVDHCTSHPVRDNTCLECLLTTEEDERPHCDAHSSHDEECLACYYESPSDESDAGSEDEP